MSTHSSKSNKCIADFCEEDFDSNWRLSFGFADPPKPESSPNVIDSSPCSGGMSVDVVSLMLDCLIFEFLNHLQPICIPLRYTTFI